MSKSKSPVPVKSKSTQLKPHVALMLTEPVEDVRGTLVKALDKNFEFLCCDLLRPTVEFPESLRRSDGEPLDNIFPWTSSELLSEDWKHMIVARLRLPESELDQQVDNKLRTDAERFVKLQLDYCTHLNLCACIINLEHDLSVNARRTIYATIFPGVQYRIWVTLPLIGEVLPPVEDEDDWGCNERYIEINNPWILWKEVWDIMDRNKNLAIALRFPDQYNENHVSRWMNEPVQGLIIKTTQFYQDVSSRAPALKPNLKDLLKRFLRKGVQVVIETDRLTPDNNLEKYSGYIERVKAEVRAEVEKEARHSVKSWTKGFENLLMDPLQPLQFNLPTHIYESFEKDPVKYVLYQKAIGRALLDTRARRQDMTKKIVILIAGAGRGPIVDSALRAAKEAGLMNDIVLYALDKNEMAVNTLLYEKMTRWHDRVSVVCTDMRTWVPPEKMDIIVSELLGSFGDNELSPECLDGAQRYLANDGIIIPQSYASFVQPIMSSRLYESLRASRSFKNFERTYVVNLVDHYTIDRPQELFSFNHPANIEDPNHTNFRYSRRHFTAQAPCVLHGFAGYFHATLYDNIVMSILPHAHTEDMISWWPLYLPVQYPITLKEGQEIVAHFFRKIDDTHVWYEWTVSSPMVLSFHNANGSHHKMGAGAC